MGKIFGVEMGSKGIFNINIRLADVDLVGFKKESGLFSPFDLEKLAGAIKCSKELFVGPYRVVESGNIVRGWKNNLPFFNGEFDILENRAGLLAFMGGGEKEVFTIDTPEHITRINFDKKKGLFLWHLDMDIIKHQIKENFKKQSDCVTV